MSSGGSVQPDHPSEGSEVAADVADWDHDGAIRNSPAYRHALWLETGGIPQGEPGPGYAQLKDAVPDATEIAATPRLAAIARLLPAAGVPRALVLTVAGVAGVASGLLVGGDDALTLAERTWRPLVEQARLIAGMPASGAAERSRLATLTSTAQAETVAVAARATPAAYVRPPRPTAAPDRTFAPARPAPAATTRRRPGPEVFDTELVEGVVLAAALNEVPTQRDAGVPSPLRVEPAAAPVVESPAATYRVQLATLRYRRNAVPVWQKFERRLGPLSDRLERYVTTAETAHGLRYLVQVGPFEDGSGAHAMCERILQKGGDCLVVPPSS